MQNLTALTQNAAGFIQFNKKNNLSLAFNAGAPTTLGTGTMGKGSLCIDITNGKLYIQGGTIGTPAWKIVTSA